MQLSLGIRHVPKGTGSDRQVVENDTFVYVPLVQSIEFLPKDEATLKEVRHSTLNHCVYVWCVFMTSGIMGACAVIHVQSIQLNEFLHQYMCNEDRMFSQ